jgi:hypothetical protein
MTVIKFLFTIIALCCISLIAICQHPHILVRPEDKEAILNKINTQAWAKKAYENMVNQVDPYVQRHKTDPEWMPSRYLMNRVPGKRYTRFFSDEDGTALVRYAGDAPVPTVRVTPHKRPPITKDGYTYKLPALEELVPYDTSMTMLLQSNAPGGKKERVNPQTFVEAINGNINQLVLDASIIYWLTGKEEYAVFAADLLTQWARGAAQQNPIEGPCRTGFLSIQTLGDGRYEPMPLAYDFLYDFLRRKNYETSYYEPVFQKIAQTMTFRGYWNNNWFAAQAPAMVFAALSLEDKSQRDYYLNFFLNKDTINGQCGHLALPSVVSKWLTPDGHWKEPGGYHNFPVSSLLIASLALEKNGYDVFRQQPALLKASYVMLKYSFPNYTAPAFGDTGTPSQSPECLEIGIAMAKKYGNEMLGQLVSAMDVLSRNKNYKRESGEYLGLLTYLPEIPPAAGITYQWPRSGALDFAKCYLQRNGMNRETGLMYVVQGASYNHNHANGMSMELYGAGHVMGIDPGKGVTYEAPMHVNYYAQWAAHNTVIAAAKSASVPYFRGGGGTKRIGELQLAAMEPKAEAPAVSDWCSFTDTRYTDISTDTKQQRTLSIIRTTESAGYYVDIYRSANPRSNEYLYHNIGNEVHLYNSGGTQLKLKPAKFPLSKAPFDPPGLRCIKDYRSTGLTDQSVTALFTLREAGVEKYMQAVFVGDKGRTFFTGKGPASGTAPRPFNTMTTPTIVSRQQGEAWKRPFIVVYEPFAGKENRNVQQVALIHNADPGNFTALKVTNKDASSQLIFQAVNNDINYNHGDWKFSGNFGVVGLRNENFEYIYLGNGTEAGFKNYALKINDSAGAASMQLNGDRLKISCRQETLITIPAGTVTKITLVNNDIEKNMVFLVDNDTISFTVPALQGAEVILRH